MKNCGKIDLTNANDSNNLIQMLNQAIELMEMNKISLEQSKFLIEYVKLLQKWNKVYNLTTITKDYDILVKHIIDCLAVLPSIYKKINENSKNVKILDVGSGAGLPGIIWSIINPAWNVYSVDAVHKKIAFQHQVKLELNLNNFFPHHIRIEDFSLQSNTNNSEKFNIITARAYADTSHIIKKTQNLLDDKGFFALLKGQDSEEFNLDKNIFNINKINIQPPFLEAKRHLVIITRISNTRG